ncbi:unnamed protein product, partial [Trichogramma brassicae]
MLFFHINSTLSVKCNNQESLNISIHTGIAHVSPKCNISADHRRIRNISRRRSAGIHKDRYAKLHSESRHGSGTNCNWYQAHHVLPQAGTASAPTEVRPIGRQSRW